MRSACGQQLHVQGIQEGLGFRVQGIGLGFRGQGLGSGALGRGPNRLGRYYYI